MFGNICVGGACRCESGLSRHAVKCELALSRNKRQVERLFRVRSDLVGLPVARNAAPRLNARTLSRWSSVSVSLLCVNVKLRLRDGRTDERTNDRIDAGNRIWCILALKYDI